LDAATALSIKMGGKSIGHNFTNHLSMVCFFIISCNCVVISYSRYLVLVLSHHVIS